MFFIIILTRSEATPQQQHVRESLEDTQPASESQVLESLGRPPKKQKTGDLFGDALSNLSNPSVSPTSPAPSSAASSSQDDESQ